jgi:hypothetical protein
MARTEREAMLSNFIESLWGLGSVGDNGNTRRACVLAGRTRPVVQGKRSPLAKVAAIDGQPLIGQPVYDSTGEKVVGTNYGSVTLQGASTSTFNGFPASDFHRRISAVKGMDFLERAGKKVLQNKRKQDENLLPLFQAAEVAQ